MKFQATADNVIIKVKKKVKSPDELLVDTGEDEPILIGEIVTAGPKVHSSIQPSSAQICVYKNRVAILPWASETHSFYVVKEENIYGILEQ